MAEGDPLVERLDDARERLERVIDGGRIQDGEDMRQLLAVREDLVFMARQQIMADDKIHARINDLDERKVEKNPNAARAFWILLTALAGGFVGLIVWLIEGVKPS